MSRALDNTGEQGPRLLDAGDLFINRCNKF